MEPLKIKDDYLSAVFKGEAYLVLDGAMGTMLQARGLVEPGKIPDLACLAHPNEVTAIHQEYVEAGAHMITTNTFGSNRRKLPGDVSISEIYQAAVACARKAGPRYVAADIGPAGDMFAPLGTLGEEEAFGQFSEQARAAEAAGADAIIIETMFDLLEVKIALLAAKETTRLPVIASMTYEQGGRTLMGTSPEIAALVLSSLGAQAVCVNCSLGPDAILPVAQAMAAFSRCPVAVRPNAGLPRVVDGMTVYDIDPAEFAEAMEPIREAGASLLGGCCGTDPRFTRQLAGLLEGKTPQPKSPRPVFAISSGQKIAALDKGRREISLGMASTDEEARLMEQAVAEEDFDGLFALALEKKSAGAEAFELAAESGQLARAVSHLQAMLPLPLSISSSNTAALEEAAFLYRGKALIGPAVAGSEALVEVLRIARQYGCAVKGLVEYGADKEGIGASPEESVAVQVEDLVKVCEEQGIPASDLAIQYRNAPGSRAFGTDEIERLSRPMRERFRSQAVIGSSIL